MRRNKRETRSGGVCTISLSRNSLTPRLSYAACYTVKIVGLFFFEIVRHQPPKKTQHRKIVEDGWIATVRHRPPWLLLAITWPKIIPPKILSNRNTRHDRARHRDARRGLARRFDPSLASQHMTGHVFCLQIIICMESMMIWRLWYSTINLLSLASAARGLD